MPEIQPWHLNRLLAPEYSRVDLVAAGANSEAHIKLFKKRGDSTMKIEDVIKTLKPEHAEVITKALADKDAALEELKATVGTPIAKEATPEDILKTVKDPAVRMLLEDQIAKTAAAEMAARVLVERETEQVALAKAKTAEGLGASEEQLTTLYKGLVAKDAALAEEVFGILAVAAGATEASMTEIGKSAPTAEQGASSEEAAWAVIEKAAEELVVAQGITKTAATSEVIKNRPELYAQYVKAQQA